MPFVSVIMASYNHEKYVGRAVQSVLDQTLQDFDLVGAVFVFRNALRIRASSVRRRFEWL